jgi:hypothetical protein
MAELPAMIGSEQDGLSVGRVTIADAEGFNVRRRQHRSIRFGEDVEVRRSPQAVACRKRYVGELGKPQRLQELVLD